MFHCCNDIRSFARYWTIDWKARQIQINVLSPGALNTILFRDITNNEYGEQLEELLHQVLWVRLINQMKTLKCSSFLPQMIARILQALNIVSSNIVNYLFVIVTFALFYAFALNSLLCIRYYKKSIKLNKISIVPLVYIENWIFY
jgi:hypothetical protein